MTRRQAWVARLSGMRSPTQRLQLDPLWIDVGIATAVALAGLVGLNAAEPGVAGVSPLRWTFAIGFALPLLARRQMPEAVPLPITVLAVAHFTFLGGMPGFGGFLALLVGA